MAKRTKFYVVWEGRHPGVYDDWGDTLEQIDGFPGAKYKAYTSPEAATEAYRRGYAERDAAELGRFLMAGRKQAPPEPGKINFEAHPEIDRTAWAVDASCQGNPGRMEYRGVDLATGRQIFHLGPLEGGTNNVGEFLAIVHAMALMVQRGERHTIYSDSRTAIGWVLRRHVRTTLKRTAGNARVFELLERGLKWLFSHSPGITLRKWDTDNWGEIPADFGRK
ncbi:MAG: ribonuclease H family protein [Muribaculaceae bacterium]|nr:ribonuclease H family protein [Muribaculaceae bacterium]